MKIDEKNMVVTINVVKDFTNAIGGRYMKDGAYSGELFRDCFLKPFLDKHFNINIEIDGTYGYPISFLSEAFEPLAKQYDNIVKRINIISSEDDNIKEINSLFNDTWFDFMSRKGNKK